MMTKFYVYALRRPDGEPFYIGKGTGRRWQKHLADWGGGKNPFKSRVIAKIRKQGKEPTVTIEAWFFKEPRAHAFEKRLIKKLGRYPDGSLTNLTDGGEGFCGGRHGPETRKRMSQSRIGVTMSEEARQNMSRAQKGLKKGPMSQAHKDAIAAGNRGKTFTPTHRRALSEAAKRRVYS